MGNSPIWRGSWRLFFSLFQLNIIVLHLSNYTNPSYFLDENSPKSFSPSALWHLSWPPVFCSLMSPCLPPYKHTSCPRFHLSSKSSTLDLLQMFFLGPLLLLSSAVQAAIIGEWNDPGRDSYAPKFGRPCEESEEPTLPAGLNFYVDSFREKVYAFNFEGCDGDGNAYGDVPTAEKNLPADSAQCEGFNMTGWPTYDQEGESSSYRCPPGSYYINYGEFSAICCDNATAEQYRTEAASLCPNGEEPYTHVIVYKNEEDEVEKEDTRRLISRNCSHRFCPESHVCIQGAFEAFCCSPPPPTEVPTTIASLEVETPAGLEGAEDGFSSLWLVVLAVVVLTSLVAGVIFWRRRSLMRKYPHDQREVASLNP